MTDLYGRLSDLLRNERGQDMVEYALITGLISVAIALAVLVILPDAFESWANAVSTCITDPDAGNCFP